MGITQDFLKLSISISWSFEEVGFYLFHLIGVHSALQFVVRKRFSILVGSWDERLTYLVHEKMRGRIVDSKMLYVGFSIVWEHRKCNF